MAIKTLRPGSSLVMAGRIAPGKAAELFVTWV